MGGADKAFLDIDGQPLIGRVINRLSPQLNGLAINANGDPARFAPFGRPVIKDETDDFAGPLAGLVAAMHWAAGMGATTVLTAPADCPFLPTDLAARLSRHGRFCVARSGSGLHPICAIWPVALSGEVRMALSGGIRKMRDVTAALGAVEVDFDASPDPFFNINTPDDLERARALLG